jgi:hypothetical protein
MIYESRVDKALVLDSICQGHHKITHRGLGRSGYLSKGFDGNGSGQLQHSRSARCHARVHSMLGTHHRCFINLDDGGLVDLGLGTRSGSNLIDNGSLLLG